MTGQISDKVIFKGDEYSLIGCDGDFLFSPAQFGLEPEMISTACYAGFYCTYELTDQALCLRKLTLREKSGNYVSIQGTAATMESGQATYRNLNVTVPFSGKLRLARDFTQDLCIHMGFQKATAFRTVLDVTLKGGRILKINYRSAELEQKRGAFKKHYQSGDLFKTPEEVFSLDLDLE